MRVTERHTIAMAVRNIQEGQQRQQRLQQQAATGKALNLPEDDPLAVERSLSVRGHLHRIEASRRNLDITRDWLSASERAMSGLGDVLGRARVLGLSGSSDTLGSDERAVLASEVDELLQQAAQLGNTTHQGLYIFAGHQTKTAPFTLQAGGPPYHSYAGDGGEIIHEIEPGTEQAVNIAGDDPFFDAMFTVLGSLRDALASNDGTAIRNAVASIDTAIDSNLQGVARLGARQKALAATEGRLDELETDLRSLLSRTEDADMAETIMQLNLEQTSYNATLAATARVLPPSLFDYLQ